MEESVNPKQEWTPERVKKIRDKATEKRNNPLDGDQAVANEVAAALAAERRRREQMERNLKIERDVSWSAQMEREQFTQATSLRTGSDREALLHEHDAELKAQLLKEHGL